MARVLILSGAGISAESGISTFRDSDGLWENHRVEDICSAGCMQSNTEETINFYDMLRSGLENKEANRAHKMIAQLHQRYPEDVVVMTQNIDNLFEKAGMDRDELVHLHGFLPELSCMKCGAIHNIGYEKQAESQPTCQKCGGDLRPNIVFFGEAAPEYAKMSAALHECEMIVVIGTSGHVLDVTYFAQMCDYSILNNLEPSEAINDGFFSKVYYDKATVAIDRVIEDIEEFLGE